MRILFLTHYYPPEVNAPASRTTEHCKAWVKGGHEVTVVTCAPNHPKGEIFPGYRNKLYQSEILDGIRVIRLWTLLAANEGFFRRILNYTSYLTAVVFALPFVGRHDIVISTSPQFFCGLAGFFAKIFKRIPWVLEIRDLWPESITSVGAMKQGMATRFLEWLEKFAYRRATHIVSVTQSFVPHIAERCGDATKISVIKNGVDLSRFTRSADTANAKQRYGLEGKFVTAYVGTHGMAHGLDTILRAADTLRNSKDIVFLMVGDGAERAKLQKKAQDDGLDNVRILGQLPKEEMPSIWAATDVSLILLRKNDLFKKVIPSKMFEAMAMQCPIILGVEGEARDILLEAGAGVAIEPENSDDLVAAVERLAGDDALASGFRQSGLKHVTSQYDRSKLAHRFETLLEELVGKKGTGNINPAAKKSAANPHDGVNPQ